MEAVAKIPLNLAERLEYEHTLRLPASWDEFLALLPQCDYRIEYTHGEIISFMGYATEAHETLVATIIRLIGNMIAEDDFTITGSNLALHVPGSQKRYYNADCTVVKGDSEKVHLSQNMYAVANPVLLVEVLSKSTAEFDVTVKGPQYREIPSLKQILFVDSESLSITSIVRHGDREEWLLRDFLTLEGEINILGVGELPVKEIYRKIGFDKQ